MWVGGFVSLFMPSSFGWVNPEDIDFGELGVDFYMCRVAQCVPVSFGSKSVS